MSHYTIFKTCLFLAQKAINKCFKGEGWVVQKICTAAKIFFLLKIKWKVSWPDSDDKQGYYSLRRPPKLIIPQAGQKRHQLAPRFGTCMYDPYSTTTETTCTIITVTNHTHNSNSFCFRIQAPSADALGAIKIHLLWGKRFNVPHWSRSLSTNER